MEATPLEVGLFHTIRYWSLFDRPVTAVQLWRGVVARGFSGGQPAGLREVQVTLQTSGWLRERLGSRYGYYFLLGNEESVERGLFRHRLAQAKWRLACRIVSMLQYLPGVRGIFASGSLAIMNTRRESDIDLFIVVHESRIWTTRLLLLLAAQLTGRRRRHWDRKAPDRVCLNHYVAEDALRLPAEVHHVYAAYLYTFLVPLVGPGSLDRFLAANDWVPDLVRSPQIPRLPHVYALSRSEIGDGLAEFLTRCLSEPVFDSWERGAERLQRWMIARHSHPEQGGRVALSNKELAFHPDSKAEVILENFLGPKGD